MERLYIGLIYKDRDSDFGVSFPDFPGCVTAGSTIEEAFEMAKEALAGHIEVMLDEGIDIPDPLPSRLRLSRAMTSAALGRRSWCPRQSRIATRVNVTLPARLLRQIDARTSNRSGFLAEAAASKLDAEAPRRPGSRKR